MLYFIAKHITTPMSRMIKASKELEKGNIGMTIEGNPMPNEEFSYLHESFNRMSLEVKYLFDYAYNEKLARKEAKIIALQSQINPHFLNNTLEMMNWQARMSGDIEVSKMIEALGTLLDYTMDRSNKKFISLSEELRCADAYFYIISMRFGQRLRIEKEIDKELLQIQVPQLILQPILENAVVHGIETVNNGVIKLKIWKKEDNLLLQITNTGKGMTKEDVERVRNILVGKGVNTISGKGKHVSLGIRNVNERIKLIYGDEYGLDILPAEGDETETISTITIPYEMKINVEKEKLLKKLLGKSK
jgi:two-component system sensor histidine kinase YesM